MIKKYLKLWLFYTVLFTVYLLLIQSAHAEIVTALFISAIFGAASTGAAAAGAALATGAAFGAAIASISIATLAVGAALGAASTLALYLLADKPDAPSGFRNAAHTFRAAVLPARWLLGRVKVGGFLIYHGEDDDSRDYDTSKGTHIAARDFWRVLVVSEGACDGLEALYLNGKKIPIVRADHTITYDGETRTYERWQVAAGAELGYRTRIEHTLQNGKLVAREVGSSLVDIYPVLDGAGNRFLPLEEASASERFDAPGPWTADHKLQGVSYIAIKVRQPSAGFRGETGNEKEWTRIPEIQFVMRGIKITWPGQTTPIWTRNAAALRYWWETERRNIPAAEIDTPTFTEAYGICEQEITRTLTQEQIDAGYDAVRPRYTLDGYVEADDNIRDVEEGFDIAWLGFVVDAGGKRYFRPGATRAPRLTITQDDWAEFPTLQPANELTNKINVARASVGQSRHHNFTEFDIGELVDDPAVQRDGVRRARDLGVLPFTTDALTARRLVATLLRGWRYEGFTLSGVLKPGETNDLFGLIPTDVVTVDLPPYGYGGANSLMMAVAEREIRPDLSIFVRLHLTAADVYEDATGFPPLVNLTPLPDFDRRVPPVPANVSVSQDAFTTETGSVARKAYIVWDAHGYRAEVRYRISADDPAEWEIVETPDNSAVLTLDKASTYKFAVRHITRFGIAGPWHSEAGEDITVQGDLSPPGALTMFVVEPALGTLRVSGTMPADEDVRGVEIYAVDYDAGGSPPAAVAADAAATAFIASEPSAPFSDIIEPAATATITTTRAWRVWARAMDTSGNAGAFTAGIDVAAPSTLDDRLDARDESLLVQIRSLIGFFRNESAGITQLGAGALQNVPAASAPSLGSITFNYLGGDIEVEASIDAYISIPFTGESNVLTQTGSYHTSRPFLRRVHRGAGTVAPVHLLAADADIGSVDIVLIVFLEGAGITTRDVASKTEIYGGRQTTQITTSTLTQTEGSPGSENYQVRHARQITTSTSYWGPNGVVPVETGRVTLSAAQLASWGVSNGQEITIRARARRGILPAHSVPQITVRGDYETRTVEGSIVQNQDLL